MRSFRLRPFALLMLATALVAFPVGVLASHQYSDVPNTNPFHGDIAAITNAGVTSGCGGGNYCPDRNVTRAEMAAFMNRLGALAANKTPVVNADKVDGLDSSAFARSDQTQHFTCSAYNMSSHGASVVGGPSSTWMESGNGDITCGVHLPDGATVTSFSAVVVDSTASYETTCWLWRSDLAGGLTYPASVSSGVGATPGFTTLTDNSIADPVIDNVGYTYSSACTLWGAAGNNLQIFRITVTYTGAP